MSMRAVPKPPPRQKKIRKPLRATKPMKRGTSPLARTPLAKVGKQKPKRVKRYAIHLRSKFWQVLRCLIWQRDGGRCRDCGKKLYSITYMHAAHVTNARFGHENLDDVKCSCADCNVAERQSRAWYAGNLVFVKADPSIGMEPVL